MNSLFEMNTTTKFTTDTFKNANDSISKLHAKGERAKIVEVCSAIINGGDVSKFDSKVVDATYNRIKELGSKALMGDPLAKYELNEIQRYVVAPVLTQLIQLPSLFGSFKDLPYNTQPKVKTYKHESIDPKFQANGGDVGFGVTSFTEYPINTQTISHGYAVDYREIQAGNLDAVAEGMNEVKNIMMNKFMSYITLTVYNSIKNATGIKFFNENAGLLGTQLDAMMKDVRRFGKVSLLGDFSMISQVNDLQGFTTTTNTKLFSEAIMEEIRRQGYAGQYKGADIVEIPNTFNVNKLNVAGTKFQTYMPEGLLYVVPQNAQGVSPIQVFRKGGLTSANAMDIISGQEITRFDMEVAADVVKGREYEIGLISDTNFDAPSTFA